MGEKQPVFAGSPRQPLAATRMVLRPPRWETNRSNTLNPRVHCEGDFVYVETTEDATDSTAPPVDTAEGATPEALREVQQAAGGLPADVLCNDKALWRTYCKAA